MKVERKKVRGIDRDKKVEREENEWEQRGVRKSETERERDRDRDRDRERERQRQRQRQRDRERR